MNDDCYEIDIPKVVHNAYVITVNKFEGVKLIKVTKKAGTYSIYQNYVF